MLYARSLNWCGYLALSVLCAAACSGQIAGGGPGGPAATGGNGPGGAGGGAPGTGGQLPPVNCTQTQAPAFHARMLTPSQYNNTILDLFRLTGDFSKGFGGGADTQLDDLGAELRANAAANVAAAAAAALLTWSPCDPAKVAPATCQQQLIDQIGMRAFRRPLTAAEQTLFKGLFDAGVKEKDFATGVDWFLTALLQSPDFLYQLAKPAASEVAGKVVPLSGHEIASRLSYFIWDSAPDDMLLSAAAARDLGDAARVQVQVDRMMQDPRFIRGVERFYSDWLTLDRFGEVSRDEPGFDSAVVSGLQQSVLLSATQLYSSPAANVASLFTGETYPMNGALRAFYKLGMGGADFAPVAMAGEGRRGLLTHPGLMTLLARPAVSNPIARGLFVRKGLLCQEIPPPPATLTIPQLPPITPGLSTRDRLVEHTNNPVCRSCHEQIDPPGLSLENWDQVGRSRTMDNGKAVDTSGVMTNGGDLDGPFANGDQLLQRIAASKDVKGCFSEHYFSFAMSRALAPEDHCSLEPLRKTFVASGDLRGLVAAIARTDAFRLRLSEGAAP